MAGEAGVMLVVLLLGLLLPVGLWVLIESETDGTAVLDRDSAERAARADTREAVERRARRDTDDGGEWHGSRRE